MDKNNEKSFGTKMGAIVGNVFVACIAICLSACMIALTVRFITLLF